MAKSNANFCIVVTGLPGSGKTTIGKQVAYHLNISFLDKDDYLEALYAERGVGDSQWRQALSRESDKLFRQDAECKSAAVLVSHWRPADLDTQSGTPTDWLAQKFGYVIELYCICPAEEATKRFIHRSRHPGHLDHLKDQTQVLTWMRKYEQHLPLGLGHLEMIDTVANQPFTALLKKLKQLV